MAPCSPRLTFICLGVRITRSKICFDDQADFKPYVLLTDELRPRQAGAMPIPTAVQHLSPQRGAWGTGCRGRDSGDRRRSHLRRRERVRPGRVWMTAG